QAVFARGHGGAAGGEHDDVVLQQFFDHLQVRVVLGGAAVVAAHHPGHPPDAAVDDVVVQGVIGTPDGAPQQVLDGLVAEAHHHGGADRRDHHRGLAVGEVVDGQADDLFGHVQGVVLVEGDVHGQRHLGPVIGGDDLG